MYTGRLLRVLRESILRSRVGEILHFIARSSYKSDPTTLRIGRWAFWGFEIQFLYASALFIASANAIVQGSLMKPSQGDKRMSPTDQRQCPNQ